MPTLLLPSIDTLDDLREHLQWAIELEHVTLPPYLCAFYSLDPAQNPDAAAVLGGVFVEEMLHFALAANVLNAVGGRPRIDSPALLQAYPRPMPHGDTSLTLSLAPFDAEALETFLRVERPAPPSAPAEPDRYETIGQFYSAIEDGLRGLCARLGERAVFSGDPARQVTTEHFRHSAAPLIAVDGLSSALRALREIVDQGEGAGGGEVWDGDADVLHPDRAEVAHYFRLQELKVGRRYQTGDTARTGPTGEAVRLDFGGIRPMRRNPRVEDHPDGHPIRSAQERFNSTYCSLLGLLEQAFDGRPERLGNAVRSMYALTGQAQALLQMPDGDGFVAGPTFDYVPPDLRF
jgi:ferritin-like protein